MKQQGWKGWWRAAGVRAIKTMAQTAVATIGAAAVLCEVSWDVVGSAAVLAGLLSLLTSLAGLPEVEGLAGRYPRDRHQNSLFFYDGMGGMGERYGVGAERENPVQTMI